MQYAHECIMKGNVDSGFAISRGKERNDDPTRYATRVTASPGGMKRARRSQGIARDRRLIVNSYE
jgi:hypothetical protein